MNDERQQPQIPALLTVLQRHGVRYVLFGSSGAVAYGARLMPGDLDICPDLDDDNLRRLGDALREIHARPRYTPGWNTLEECERWVPRPLTAENFDHLFETALGDLDVVPRPFGPNGDADRFDYASLAQRAVTIRAFGVDVTVAHVDDLVASKMSRRREKDLRALAELERIRRRVREGDGTAPPAPDRDAP